MRKRHVASASLALFFAIAAPVLALGDIGSSGGGGGVSAALVCLLTGGADCTMSGSVIFDGAAPDLTTATNEDLTLAPAGTGSVSLQSGDHAVDVRDAAGNIDGSIETHASGAGVLFRASGGAGVYAGPSAASIGHTGAVNDNSGAACLSESISLATGGTHLACAQGGGLWSIRTRQAATCANNGGGTPAALALTVTSSAVYVTNNDADGCAITLAETNLVAGTDVVFVVVSSAGGVVTFDDTAGAHNSPACANTTGLSLEDSYRVHYSDASNDLFVGLGCADN